MEERLQKVLAQAGVASRRKCEEIILAGDVTVNGQVVTELGTKVTPGVDQIEVNGESISFEQKVYILLNKPRGVVTTAYDPQGRKTVIDLIDVPERIYPVGRLDLDTAGLLILTNDGALANGLMHPSKEIDKTYRTWVRGTVKPEAIKELSNGVELEDGMTAPAKVRLIEKEGDETLLEIVIHEGRNRQVRRMCEAVGHPVKSLMRVQLAFLKLGRLRYGEYRPLTPLEIDRLYAVAGVERAK
ncbi:pseudouridine synthase [Tumebacillus permanentifrigoris]|uniref:Pseudouridine synthase n=1 Tax=Tumebacillus permanentifrigoris TaxID=378543 RepID=A0A316DD49_9BACL|nr:pseudouridine synthase [Tumebacillus permanentifrigoris]PWK14433.1 pseudouridine synthase [Tumebacillus permanentifrigoris]